MNKIDDIINLTKFSLEKSIELYKKIPVLFIVPIIYSLIYYVFTFVFMINFGVFSNIITAVLNSAVIASYLYVLHNAIYYKKFKLSFLYEGISVFFLKTLIFIIVINLIFTLILAMRFEMLFGFYTLFGLFIAFNPMPEIIYVSEYNGKDMFYYNFRFIKNNWIQWYVINLLLWISAMIFSRFSYLIPYLSVTLIVIYLSVIMVFRGFLFRKLHGSSFAKRSFDRYNN